MQYEQMLFSASVDATISQIKSRFKTKNKLLIAGNGGSATQASHFAAEIVGRFEKERQAMPAISLNTDIAILTAIANDYGYENVFARQIEALGEAGDIFFGITTSGNSENIIKAIIKAKEKGIFTIVLTAKDGGKVKDLANICIKVPSENTATAQEMHLMIIHHICREVEK